MKKNILPQIGMLLLSGLYFCLLSTAILSCKHKSDLDEIIIHDNPLVKAESRPEILLDHLDNPSAPLFVGNRIIFAESGRGTLFEYKEEEIVPLISGFGLDNYAGYSISIMGLTTVPEKDLWIIGVSLDSGHVLLFDGSSFPTSASEGREIEMIRTDATNPFGIILIDKGNILVASGGTKSVYQSVFDAVNPNPLQPVYDVSTGVAGIAEDPLSGNIYGAVIGSGEKDGHLIRWNPHESDIRPQTITTDFYNLIDVLIMPNGHLLLLEFGLFDTPNSGRILAIDPEEPHQIHPVASGFDAPSGFSLSPDNKLLISTFGKNKSGDDGMLITLQLELKP